jgi:hypothetical protein
VIIHVDPETMFAQLHIVYEARNVIKYDAFLWNWNKNAINDDGIFIASCINFAIVDEIQLPIIEECRVLATQLP